ncbi:MULTISPECIES: hypothetical protein [unclassified Microbacterium]|uniref:hypothetical protein n=1 Tax=Microbacterium TaxID=33882 RepID=UPI003BA01194
MNLNDRAVAVIRTAVPVLVGSLIAWLTSLVPAVADVLAWIDANLSDALGGPVVELIKLAAVGAVITAYYALVRWLSKRWPQLELLLGSSKVPVHYVTPAPQTSPPEPDTNIAGPRAP